MTDDSRPRPAYGEYATPEAQAKAMGFSHPVGSPVPGAPAAPLHSVAPPIASSPADSIAARSGRPVNRVVTIALLTLGLLNILASASSYLNLPATLQTIYANGAGFCTGDRGGRHAVDPVAGGGWLLGATAQSRSHRLVDSPGGWRRVDYRPDGHHVHRNVQRSGSRRISGVDPLTIPLIGPSLTPLRWPD
jgi:hypothetical protein